ncbi:MAG: tryptophan--tRNA ligase [candidate division WOR-3 bacterium]
MKRVLSGLRPTGKIHIGNYFGALINWVNLQKEYECFYEVADWHVLTTDYKNTEKIKEYIIEAVCDWISIGIDPEKSVIFIQSQVKEHAELYLLFGMLISIARLERNPTVKEQVRDLGLEENISYGHLGYPVLQASDILIYKANLVPVGEDQLPHIEITREIARRFNYLYGETFPLPEPILTKTPRVPGIDGKARMSKSLNNTIFVDEEPEELERKIMKAYTDPMKIKLGDPGHPDGCVVFAYHSLIDGKENPEIREGCESGKLGCVECKKNCINKMVSFLAPFREKKKELKKNIKRIIEIIEVGNKKAQEVAKNTLEDVREKMKLW